MTYQARRPAQLETLDVRGLQFQLYRWPAQDAAGDAAGRVVLVHGWGDTGETYQFVADELAPNRTLVAYDARGFGRTQWPSDGYWFPEYLADLGFLLPGEAEKAPFSGSGNDIGYAAVKEQGAEEKR
jgi:alpha-beta hydrolase superfamily lysophospholipase